MFLLFPEGFICGWLDLLFWSWVTGYGEGNNLPHHDQKATGSKDMWGHDTKGISL